jgi:hypothetical protein
VLVRYRKLVLLAPGDQLAAGDLGRVRRLPRAAVLRLAALVALFGHLPQ